MSNDPVPADIETSSEDYAARFAGPVGTWMLSRQERIALRLLEPFPGTSILDVGGGHAQLASPLCNEGYAVTVLGSDASCASRLEALLKEEACVFKTGNLLDPPFEDKSFESVVSVRLLPHCDDWPKLIAQFCRMASGRVIVDYPTSQSLNRIAPALFGAKKKLEGNTRPFRLFRHREVTDEFEKHGFTLTRRAGEFFLPMVLHRTLRCRPLSAAMEGVCRGLGLAALWGSPVLALYTRNTTEGSS